MNELTEIYNKDFKRQKNFMPPFKEKLANYDIPIRFTFFNKFIKDDDKILDCGCFDGYMLHYLLTERDDIKCYGIDVSDDALKEAKTNLKKFKKRVTLRQALVENIPYDDGSFNIVIASELMEHVKAPIEMVNEMYRVTKEGGYMLLSVPMGKNLRDPLHLHIFNFYDLMELFDQLGSDYKIYKYFKSGTEFKKNIFVIAVKKGVPIEPDDNEEVD